MVQQHYAVQYDNWWCFVVSALVIVQSIMFMDVHQNLAWNEYPDFLVMVVGGWSAIYILGFWGKKVSNNCVGAFFALLGRESLYIMAFHILGFFIGNSLMLSLGVFDVDDPKGGYTYCCGERVFVILCYVMFGIAIPISIMWIWRFLLNFLQDNVSRFHKRM